MHTRRLASFILGAWLLGSLFMAFLATQSFKNVDRILNSPPPAVAKYIEDVGMDVTRLLLRYQSSELNRFFFEAWGVVQLGIGAAFLAACLLTAHRSKFLIFASVGMILLVAYNTFYVLPTMVSLGRSFDFLPPTAAPQDRENFQDYHVMYSVGEVIKLLLGVALAARLLFDRYGWKQKLMPVVPGRNMHRRRRSTPKGKTADAVDPVDHAQDSHVNG